MNIVLTQKIEDGTDPQVRAETCPLALMGREATSTSHLEKELGENQEGALGFRESSPSPPFQGWQCRSF